MKRFLQTIDDVLRGHMTRKEDLAAGRIEVPVRTLVFAGLLFGGIYGAFMGLYASLRAESPSYYQLLASSSKVPLLFILTLVVTYPSLYVVSAMFDSRLRHAETLRLLLVAMTANLALLASLGPVTGFFTLCTDNYAFMMVLNVLFFSVTGFVGLGFLRRALKAVFDADPEEYGESSAAAEAVEGAAGGSNMGSEQDARDSSAASRRPEASGIKPSESKAPKVHARMDRATNAANRVSLRVFTFWLLIYGVVGAQMGWVLRPFVGNPDLPFEFFRSGRDSNFFAAFFHAFGQLFR